nr:MAG TPA: hypothetical protein [Caudoviricetes sp.]
MENKYKPKRSAMTVMQGVTALCLMMAGYQQSQIR